MSDSNHYQTLDVHPHATTLEIKQAYRRLAKRFHPDSNSPTADPEKIIQVNAAY
ncbi:MAG: DnaJ domain-containing protein, partial [Moorea sp. SIO3G5]|nr:DnaJ domain-containing protein [Moorena sp. SIO3G5]